MDELLLFALIWVPLAILIGIAAASISFTAWNLIVPIIFIGFGFPIYESLFLSIFVDLVDSAILTAIYGVNKKIDFKGSMIYLVPILFGAIVAFFVASDLLAANTHLLRGGIGYITMILGVNFIAKGWKGLKLQRTQGTQQIQDQPVNFPPTPKKDWREKLSPTVVKGLIYLSMGISGAMSGFMGIGSGMNFVIILLIFVPAYDLQKATATGAFLMFVLMICCSILIFPLVNMAHLLPYLGIAVSFSGVSTLVASRFALRLSKEKLNLAVGIVMEIAAIVATVISLSL